MDILYGDSDTLPELVAFYDTLGIRRTHSRLNPWALTYFSHIQGVSENMQQLLISTKMGSKPGRIKVIYQIQPYNHTILLIIKNPETDTK